MKRSMFAVLTALLIGSLCPGVLAQTVTTDSGGNVAGSLRAVLNSAAPGATIRFAATLDGATISLDVPLVIDKTIAIDASNLPNGIYLSGQSTHRIAEVNAGGLLIPIAVNFLNGRASSGNTLFFGEGDFGGAIRIRSGGELIARRCTFYNNFAFTGGGAVSVANGGSASLNHCTLANNEVNSGGLFFEIGGGGIHTEGTLSLLHCTLKDNRVLNSDDGAGVYQAAGTMTFENTVFDHDRFGDEDVRATSVPTLRGVNGFTDFDGSMLSAGPNAIRESSWLLSDLGDFGGPTLVVVPRRGSGLLDRAGPTTETEDQRGFARAVDGDNNGSALPDIGAAERTPVRLVTSRADAGEGTLREAIDTISPDTTIRFAPNVDSIALSSGPLRIDQALVIDASDHNAPVIIRGAANLRCFDVDVTGGIFTRVQFINLHLTNANLTDAGESGAAAKVDGLLSFMLNNCIVSNCRSDGDGGALHLGTNVVCTVEHSLLMNNESISGSGGAVFAEGTFGTEASTFDGNQAATHGGAVAGRNTSDLDIADCIFRNNIAGQNGGAVYTLEADDGFWNRSSFYGNSAGADGGAAWIDNPAIAGGQNLRIQNCTVFDNEATGVGGGVRNWDGIVELYYCTIVGNRATAGGGVASYGDTATRTALEGCIVASNLTSDIDMTNVLDSNSITSLNNNVVGAGNVVNAGTNSFTHANDLTNITDPQLNPLGLYGRTAGRETPVMPPRPGSPAIDRGPHQGILLSDQRGAPRDENLPIDAGSVEVQPNQVNTVADDGSAGSLRKVIEFYTGPDPITFGDLSYFPIQLTQGPLEVNHALSISGDGRLRAPTIDALDRSRVMNVGPMADVCIYRMHITGGKEIGLDEPGGAFHIAAGAQLKLDRCTLYQNSARADGGAIYNMGTLRLDHCTLAQNEGVSGGAVYAVGETDIIHCTIADNRAFTVGGGVFQAGSDVDMRNSIVAENAAALGDLDYAGTDGVQLFASGPNLFSAAPGVSVRSSLPIIAPAHLSSLTWHGGGVLTMHPLAGSPVIDAVPFASDTGAIWDQRGAGYSRRIDDPLLPDSIDIGAVEVGPVHYVTNSDAPGEGGSSPGSLRSVFENQTDTLGTVIRFDTNVFPATINLSLDELEISLLDLKSVFIDASDIPVASDGSPGVRLDCGGNNRAFACYSPGSCIALYGIHLTNGNGGGPGSSINGFPHGGGMKLQNGAFGSFDHAAVSNGIGGSGGGIASIAGYLALHHSQVEECESIQGGGIWCSDGDLLLEHCVIESNESTGIGGGVSAGAVTTIRNSRFTGNEAAGRGGGFSTVGYSLHRLADTAFVSNTSGEHGGGCYLDGLPSPVVYTDNHFSLNAADQGGGLFGEGAYRFARCRFEANTAIRDGGGLYARASTIVDSSFVYNQAGGGGGGIYSAALSNFGEQLYCTNLTVAANLAKDTAGIFGGASDVNLMHCTISSNTATAGTGGFVHLGTGTAVISNSVIAGNFHALAAGDLAGETPTFTGYNMLGSPDGNALSDGPNLMIADPQLAPLGKYGSSFYHMPPRSSSSPVLNAAVPGVVLYDQLGLPRGATPALGAIEYHRGRIVQDTDGDFIDDELELRNGLNPFDPNDAQADADGDGASNISELDERTDPQNRSDFFGIVAIERVGLPSSWKVTYRSYPGERYRVGFSADLINVPFSDLPLSAPASGEFASEVLNMPPGVVTFRVTRQD